MELPLSLDNIGMDLIRKITQISEVYAALADNYRKLSDENEQLKARINELTKEKEDDQKAD